VAGGILEAALLLASIAFDWIWGTYRPAPIAFLALLVVGVAAAAATSGLGGAMWRTSAQPVVAIHAPPTTGPPVPDVRANLALFLATRRSYLFGLSEYCLARQLSGSGCLRSDVSIERPGCSVADGEHWPVPSSAR